MALKFFRHRRRWAEKEFADEKEDSKTANHGGIKSYCIAQHNNLQCINLLLSAIKDTE